MHRTLPLLAALVALVLPVSASAADPFTATDIRVNAVVGPNDDTTCTIDATIFKPAGASAEHPVAAILATNGFGGSKDDFDTLAASYAKRGYAFLAYSGLGFGGPDQNNPNRKGSTCKIELDDPDWDGKAASAMIDYLGGGRADTDGHTIDWVIRDIDNHAGGSSPHDPRVGMIGGSYGGQVQFAAADVDPRLDTIIPQITWNDLAYSLAPNNTGFTSGVTSPEPGIEKYEWTSLFFGLGIADGGTGTLGGQDPSHFAGMCPNFDDRACTTKAQMDATGYPSPDGMAFARHASVSSYISNIRIPTFLAQGQSDTLFNLNEAIATYQGLRKQGTPVKMLWKDQGHSGNTLGASETQDGNPEAAYASREYLEWFDYYLRGIGDPPKLDVQFWRDWIKTDKGQDAAPAVASAPAYPVADDQTYYLSGTGDLVTSAAAVKAGAPQFQFTPGAPTSYTETSALDQSQAPSDQSGTYAEFKSPALAQDTDVAGEPTVTLSLSAPLQAQSQGADPGGRLVIFAKLFEEKADGTEVLAHRLIAPVRVPDVTKPFTVTLPGIVHRFANGSKFRLVIAASDAAYKNNNAPGQVTVNVDPKAPLALTIPVLGAGDTPAAGASQPAGSGLQPQVRQEGKQSSAASLTGAKASCKRNRRVITIHFTGVKRPDRIVSRKVTLNGKRLKLSRKAKVLRINLKRRKAGTYRVFVLVKSKHGKVRRTARTYKVC